MCTSARCVHCDAPLCSMAWWVVRAAGLHDVTPDWLLTRARPVWWERDDRGWHKDNIRRWFFFFFGQMKQCYNLCLNVQRASVNVNVFYVLPSVHVAYIFNGLLWFHVLPCSVLCARSILGVLTLGGKKLMINFTLLLYLIVNKVRLLFP